MNFSSLLAWRENNPSYKGAQSFGCFLSAVRIVQRLGEPLDVPPIVTGNIRMHIGNIRRGLTQASHYVRLLTLKAGQSCLHRRLIHPVLDCRHDSGNSSLDLAQGLTISSTLHMPGLVKTLYFLCKSLNGLGRHQTLL